jgi:hypothetical protein
MARASDSIYEPRGRKAKGGTVEILPDGTEKVHYSRGKNPNSIKNLEPHMAKKGHTLSSEKAQEMSKQATIKRRQNRKLRYDLNLMLSLPLKDGDMTSPEMLRTLSKEELSDKSNLDAAAVIAAKLIRLATSGNIKAIELIYDHLGQTPQRAVDVTVKASPVSELSTEELRALAQDIGTDTDTE